MSDDSVSAEQTSPSVDLPSVRDRRPLAALKGHDKRRARNRALAVDKHRTSIKVGRTLAHLRDIDAELASIHDAVKSARPVYDANGQPVIDPRTGAQMTIANSLGEDEARAYAVRLKALQQRADVHFRKLAKVMPDLNRTTLTDPNGASPFSALAQAIADAAQHHSVLADGRDG